MPENLKGELRILTEGQSRNGDLGCCALHEGVRVNERGVRNVRIIGRIGAVVHGRQARGVVIAIGR